MNTIHWIGPWTWSNGVGVTSPSSLKYLLIKVIQGKHLPTSFIQDLSSKSYSNTSAAEKQAGDCSCCAPRGFTASDWYNIDPNHSYNPKAPENPKDPIVLNINKLLSADLFPFIDVEILFGFGV